jgi:hypothetical protein
MVSMAEGRATQRGNRVYNAILTNPLFGRKQSYRIMRADGEVEAEREDYDRSDFLQPPPLLFQSASRPRCRTRRRREPGHVKTPAS